MTLESRKTTPLPPDARVVIIGAGPAGLTAAYELARAGVRPLVLEADARVGGLSQTAEYRGFRFDIGGHRFFTKIDAVRDLWREMLGPDFIRRPRLSRIFYNGQMYDYPLKPANALRNLGPFESVAIVASYLMAKLRPIRPEVSFEDWVTNRFGRRLYRMFFKTYTEKVWGIPCRTISSEWAAQRIQGLSLVTAAVNMLFPSLNRRAGKTVKTLIDEFEYPRFGPGMMWEAFASAVERLGGQVLLNTPVTALRHDGERVTAVETTVDGVKTVHEATHVVSTMPLRHLVENLTPAMPAEARRAAADVKYRGFRTVALVIDEPELFPDNWIYIHDPSVKVGRIQNFKNWSPEMVPDASKTCLGLEYFCTQGDDLWTLGEREFIALATDEIDRLGLARRDKVIDGAVVSMPAAYPVYDETYAESVKTIRGHLAGLTNLQTIGRNGTHTYNNQDHSMVMGMLAARNLFGAKHDLWAITGKNEYLEEVRDDEGDAFDREFRSLASTQPMVPASVGAGK